MFDFLHRVLSGQTLSPRELRIAGALVLIWFLMDAIEWSDWAFHWRADAPQACNEDPFPTNHAR
jgi:hypothetical protein